MEREWSRRSVLSGLATAAVSAALGPLGAPRRQAGSATAAELTPSIIIGVHGLLNKPPKETEESWWADSLAEGLRSNRGSAERPPFELAYWADRRYEKPEDVATLVERYESAPGQLRRFPRLSAAERIRLVLEKWGGRALDKEKDLVGLGTNIEKLLGVSFADLAAYYATENDRRGIRDRLSSVLARHRDKTILLIAHSMGSIIAYDVLREHDRSNPVTVQHLVTIGSPLGLPIVTFHIRQEFGGTVTPAGVRQWSNMADPGDKVALDNNLADEYKANASGVTVRDILVYNEYRNHEGKPNKHKSFGYLRAPELSDVVWEFRRGG